MGGKEREGGSLRKEREREEGKGGRLRHGFGRMDAHDYSRQRGQGFTFTAS